jgi:hypothetical protein
MLVNLQCNRMISKTRKRFVERYRRPIIVLRDLLWLLLLLSGLIWEWVFRIRKFSR